MKWSKKQLKEIQEYLNHHPLDPFWDCRDGFGKDQVTKILAGDSDQVEFEWLEYNGCWLWEESKAAILSAIDFLYPDMDLDDPDEAAMELWDYVDVPVDMDMKRLARDTSAYICVQLPVEHIPYFRE